MVNILTTLLLFEFQASARETIWVIRIGIFVVGAAATAVGLTVKSIYSLFTLCSDLVFVILFPQLLGAVHIPFVNTYGSVAAYILGLFFRLSGGEKLVGLPPMIKYPGYKDGKQYFPFRTMSMLISLVTLLSVSYLFKWLLESGRMPEKYDYLKVLQRKEKQRAKEETHPMVDYNEKGEKQENGVDA